MPAKYKTSYPAKNTSSFTMKEKIVYTIAGVAFLTTCFFLGRSLIRKAKSNIEEKKTYEEGSPADLAKKLKMAFENDAWWGWGTDEVGVRNVFRQVKSKEEFKQVMASYQRLYASSLMADLKDELQSSEYNEMLAILSVKPDTNAGASSKHALDLYYRSWAKRLKSAFDVTYAGMPGTDEEAIRSVFLEIPSQSAFQKVADAYKTEFGKDLIRDLKSELEFWEYNPMMELITKKPKS